ISSIDVNALDALRRYRKPISRPENRQVWIGGEGVDQDGYGLATASYRQTVGVVGLENFRHQVGRGVLDVWRWSVALRLAQAGAVACARGSHPAVLMGMSEGLQPDNRLHGRADVRGKAGCVLRRRVCETRFRNANHIHLQSLLYLLGGRLRIDARAILRNFDAGEALRLEPLGQGVDIHLLRREALLQLIGRDGFSIGDLFLEGRLRIRWERQREEDGHALRQVLRFC